MEMKRLSLPARHRAANKAQENPHGAVVVMIFFLIAFLLAARSANAQWAVMNKYAEFGLGNFYMFVPRETDAKRIILNSWRAELHQLVYDPVVNTNTVMTSFNATLVEGK